MTSNLRAILAAALLVAFAGCSAPEPAGSTANPVTCTVESFAQASVDLRVGQRLDWNWTADQELAFDVMKGEDARFGLDGAMADTRSYTAQSAGLHELQWTNLADANATLTYTLKVDGQGVDAACVDPTL